MDEYKPPEKQQQIQKTRQKKIVLTTMQERAEIVLLGRGTIEIMKSINNPQSGNQSKISYHQKS